MNINVCAHSAHGCGVAGALRSSGEDDGGPRHGVAGGCARTAVWIHLRIRLAGSAKTGLGRRRRCGWGWSSGCVSSMPGGGPISASKAESLDARGVTRQSLSSSHCALQLMRGQCCTPT